MNELEKKKSIQQNYNESAMYYDARYLKLQFQKLLILFKQIKSLDTPLLDMGAGTGIFWEFLQATNYIEEKLTRVSENNEEWIEQQYQKLMDEPNIVSVQHFQNKKKLNQLNFVGIDLSLEMLKIFNHRTRNQRLKPLNSQNITVQLICSDGEHLPFRDRIFNSIISLTALQNLAEPLRGIAELNRVSTNEVQLGITFLKKKMQKSEFEQAMKKYWDAFHLISTFDPENQTDIEDWIGIN